MSEKRKFINPADIDDPAYALLKVQINNALKKVSKDMEEMGSEDGNVTIKIMLSTEEAAVPYKADYVQKLSVGWKVTQQITIKDQADGGIYDWAQYYLEFDADGIPVMKKIQDAQHEIDEYL